LAPPVLELFTNVSPVGDPGRFDLSVDGHSVAHAVANGALINVPGVSAQTHTVIVTAVAPTHLADYNLVVADDCDPSGVVGTFVGNHKTCEILITHKQTPSVAACQAACTRGEGACMAHTHDAADRKECVFDYRSCLQACR